MKQLCILPALFALALFASCQKQQTEEERRAEIDKQVEQRLAAERAAQEQQQLDQREADLKAREQSLALQQQQVTEAAATPAAAEETFATNTEDASGSAGMSTRSRSHVRHRSTEEYGMFYEKLEPYGDWIETNDYGYVWQPRIAEQSRAWRPYTDGHWVYTDAGWTFVSDDPFGWAAYHYGRWTRLRGVGWVWVPGNEWAPAWVSWRTSNQYVGWAPLPPEAEIVRGEQIENWADSYYDIGPEQYTFVPTNEIGVQRLASVAVPIERNVTIVTETRNVTNITYNGTFVVNHGPSYEQLLAASAQPIERYRLERQSTVQGESRPVVRGEVIAFAAPAVTAMANIRRPPVVKRTIANAVVENGWSGISNKAAADQARAKIAAEATPPPNAPAKAVANPQSSAAPAATATAASKSPASTTAAPSATASASAAAAVTATPRASVTAAPGAAPSAATAKPSPSATATIENNSPSPQPTAAISRPQRRPLAVPPVSPLQTPANAAERTPPSALTPPSRGPHLPPPALRPSSTASSNVPQTNPTPAAPEKTPMLRTTPANARPEGLERPTLAPPQSTPPALRTPPARVPAAPPRAAPHKPNASASPSASAE